MAFRLYNDQVSTDADEAQPHSAAPAQSSKRGELLNLDPKERVRIGKFVQDAIDSWEETSGTHQSNLRKWNDLLEGVIEESDYPWEGASQLHIPLIALHLITLHSVVCRSMVTVDPLWYGDTLDPTVRDIVPEIEEMLTYQSKSQLNIVEAVRDVVWNTGRDGLGWLMVPHVEEYERVADIVVVESIQDFTDEFPDAESAGMDDDEYVAKLNEITMNASEDAPMEIPVNVERLVYRGPKAEVVDEADMIRVPMTARDVRGCRLYGRRFYLRRDDLRKRVQEQAIWKDAGESLIKSRKVTDPASQDSWRQNRDQIEGITTEGKHLSDEYEMVEGVVKLDLDKDGMEEKYFFTYSRGTRKLLGLSEYVYRKEIFIPFRMIKRPGRMLGRSVPEMLEDMNHELDASIRMDINSDSIENVPIFKGKKSSNKDLDPDAEENTIRPGVMFWLEDPAAFEIVNTARGNRAGSTNRRQELMRYAEMLVGPTQLLSGRESPVDPEAPGNKTIALIQQSNMRIEDYINELRFGFDALGDLLLSHNYQFGTNEIGYQSIKETGVMKSLRRKQLRGDIRLKTHGVTATLNPEAEFGKAMMWFNVLSKEASIGGDPVKRRNLIQRLMLAGRLEGRDELLQEPDEAQMEADKMKEAEIRTGVIKELIAKGVIPPPPPPGPTPMPGAPPGAVGLPPVNNLPPPGI